MKLQDMNQILKQADNLSPSEKLLLASRLIQDVQSKMSSGKSSPKWKDAIGLLSYPALGEDAQAYIRRTRFENDIRRAHRIGDGE